MCVCVCVCVCTVLSISGVGPPLLLCNNYVVMVTNTMFLHLFHVVLDMVREEMVIMTPSHISTLLKIEEDSPPVEEEKS